MFKKLIGVSLITIMVLTSSLAVYAAPLSETGEGGPGVVYDQTKNNAGQVTPAAADQTQSDSSIKEKEAADKEVAEKEKLQATNASLIDKLLSDSDAAGTEQIVVSITKPENDKDSTYKKSYILTGSTTFDDVTVYLAKYNEDSKKYEAFANTAGDNSWNVGSYGPYSKEAALTVGPNKFKLVACKNSQDSELKTEDVQVSYFTIMRLEESIKDKLTRKVKDLTKDLTDGINNIFNKK
jgi:hypothetical protein